jgi:hypothetical protein
MVYTYNHFDLTRIQKGMIKEHWNDLRVDPILSLVQKPN